MTETFVRPDRDRDEEETLGLWARVGVYSAGVATAMAIFFWGAVPSFRQALDGRLSEAGTVVDGAAAAQGALSGDALLSRVRSALDAAAAQPADDTDAARPWRVSAIGEVITLRGSAASEAERARLGAAALAVDGVGRVENLLVVDGGAGSDAAASNGAAGTATGTATGTAAGANAATASAVTQATTSPAVVTSAASAVASATTTAAPPTTATPTTAAAPPTTAAPAPAAAPPTTTASPPGGTAAGNQAGTAPDTTPDTAAEATAKADAQAQLSRLLADEPLLFDTSSPELRPESYATLDRIAELLAAVPAAAVEVQGHTDDVGPSDANLLLSQDRAGRVRLELIARGIDPARLSANGYGMTAPAVSNDSEENRQRNRRIQLVLS